MKRILSNILIIICLIIIGFVGYQLYDYFSENMEQEAKFKNIRSEWSTKYKERQKDYEKLYMENSDFVGWIRVDGTGVDYPVMQTENDPEFYLYRNFQKEDSKSGTPFASAISDIRGPGNAIIVYGHKMKDGSMFGSLGKYEDKEFYEKHDMIWFDTLSSSHEYEIFSVFKVRVDNSENDEFKYYNISEFENENEFDQFIKKCNEYEIYDTGKTAKYGDKIIMLSTCEYSQTNGRLIIIGKEIDKTEKVPVYNAPEDFWKKIVLAIAVFLVLIIIISVFLRLRSRRLRRKNVN